MSISKSTDEESRPRDVDAINQKALALMGESGGWPLTMLLLPDGKPFLGRHVFSAHPRLRPPQLPPGARSDRAAMA